MQSEIYSNPNSMCEIELPNKNLSGKQYHQNFYEVEVLESDHMNGIESESMNQILVEVGEQSDESSQDCEAAIDPILEIDPAEHDVLEHEVEEENGSDGSMVSERLSSQSESEEEEEPPEVPEEGPVAMDTPSGRAKSYIVISTKTEVSGQSRGLQKRQDHVVNR